MKVKFKQDADTMNYGKVKEGDTVTVKAEDGKAFINNGIATEVKSTGVKDNG